MDIDKIEAGRELDELIAKHIFNFWWDEKNKQWYGKIINSQGKEQVVYASIEAASYIIPLKLWGPSISYSGLPEFSMDMTAAWTVVRKLSKNIGCFYMWQHVDYATVDCGVKCDAETMPLAICRAALKAVTP